MCVTHAMNKDNDAPALAVKGLGHAYGTRRALDGVSFEVPAGRFTVLLGLNGAGKSTLFSLVTRLYDAREGGIEVFGYDVSRAPGEALRRLGVVFQSRTLDLDLSVMQNLTYHAALHGISGDGSLALVSLIISGISDRTAKTAIRTCHRTDLLSRMLARL